MLPGRQIVRSCCISHPLLERHRWFPDNHNWARGEPWVGLGAGLGQTWGCCLNPVDPAQLSRDADAMSP
ncbi:hypothetical protein BZL30_4174 [Mycobacterium kansasii]|uniref:Uncharacterized protein n=1 Tax=Mycobacterium kansasii TaxID=1768 RepID=A0A1V3X966_MYCKA|nr:hypothetical protein BZL30_4174 [Mycobacterium kansasii]